MSEPTMLPPYDGAKKYVVPIQEGKDGAKRMMFRALGDLPLHPAEQVLLHYAPGMPYGTVYTYLDINDIIEWIQQEQALVRSATHRMQFDTDYISGREPENADVDHEAWSKAKGKIIAMLNEKYGTPNSNLRGVGQMWKHGKPAIVVGCDKSWVDRLVDELPDDVDNFFIYIEPRSIGVAESKEGGDERQENI